MIFTKLHIPKVDKSVIHRLGLIEKLSDGLDRKLIMVSAPAGYGKTTLIVDWLSQKGIPTAWCSIDNRDNDPIEFLKLIITSVNKQNAEIGKSSLDILHTSQSISMEYVFELWINDLLQMHEEMLLVIDDVHLVKTKHVIDIISFLIEYKPENLKLVISSRTDPPIALSRLRSQNEILEIRSKDLSFSEHDISTFYNKQRLKLSKNDTFLLKQKTEGWIAGLQLTALSLQGNENVSEYIETMAGDNRYIMDYLLEEVMSLQDEETNKFLLQTSILEKMEYTLCNAVLKNDNSQEMLERLDKSNVFLIPLDDDRKWYRYHHLFSDLLKNKLTAINKNSIPELHHRASLWFESQQQFELAISHTIQAGNTKRAMELIEPQLGEICEKLEYFKIFKYGSLFSEEEILSNDNFCVIYAWTMAVRGDIPRSEFFLEKLLDKGFQNVPSKNDILSKIYLTYSSISIAKGDIKSAYKYNELVHEHLIVKDNSWNIWAHINKAEALLLNLDIDGCIKSNKKALSISKRMNNFFMMLTIGKTAYALILNGKYNESYKICKDLLHVLMNDKSIDTYRLNVVTSIIRTILGYIQVEWGKIDEGFENLSQGYIYSQKTVSITFKSYCAFNLALSYSKTNKIDEALSIVNELESQIVKDDYIGLKVFINYITSKLFIAKGQEDSVEIAENVLQKREDETYFEYGFDRIVVARKLILDYKYYEAFELVEKLIDIFEKGGVNDLLLEAYLLKTKACIYLKQNEMARIALAQAIALAQDEKYVRSFIVEGNDIRKVLTELNKDYKTQAAKYPVTLRKEYMDMLLAVFEKEKEYQKDKQEELLSSRELDTLKHISEGLSNKAIAEAMFISITTVKTHVRNILLKLEAKNRMEAVLSAKEQGILLS